MTTPRLLVIICSTRPGRVGKPVGDWFATAAREDGTFDVTVADLAELNLPFMDEPNHPRLRQYTKDHTKAWSATVAAADAVVWVQPEYNYSMCAAQANAIDFLFGEWARVATSFVSYGGVSGGLRGVQHAKNKLTTVQSVYAGNAVMIPMAARSVKDGVFTPTPQVADSVAPMLTELAELVGLLAPARAAMRASIATS